jgi:uncharacterized protein YjlB
MAQVLKTSGCFAVSKIYRLFAFHSFPKKLTTTLKGRAVFCSGGSPGQELLQVLTVFLG